MYALVDCNNFFVSCERVFNPKLNNKPVIVLSNNDGCTISRSNEAKALDIKMGAPYFKIQEIVKKNKVKVFSSNFALYGDMSARVMHILSEFCAEIEIYSIDEAFLKLDSFTKNYNLKQYGENIANTIMQYVGIPVSVGIGKTKTLAKIAASIAKKKTNLQESCVVLDDDETTDFVLDNIDVGDLWGVGRRLQAKLLNMKIITAKQLKYADYNLIKRRFSIILAKTLLELKGTCCINLEQNKEPKKNIICSRSFGSKVTALFDLEQAVSAYTARAAEKLRAQKSVVKTFMVFVQTGFGGMQSSCCVTLLSATNDTSKLISRAKSSLQAIYKPGLVYKKAGVILLEILPETPKQLDCFAANDNDNSKLMATIDSINSQMGKNTVQFAASGLSKPWAMKRELLSPAFTTCWGELPIVK